MINIAGLTAVNDPSYRYKMPKIVGKVEGKGNGIKTVLLNVDDLSVALKRDPAEITKFFGCELGAQTTFAADRAIVNGAHRESDLQTHLSKYIENFVLCANCHLPETHYKIKEGLISQKCIACGHKEGVDMRHKLTTFILGQHKKAKELAKKEGKKEDKEGKKEKKDKKDDADKKEKEKDKSSRKKSSSSPKPEDDVGETVFGGAIAAATASEDQTVQPDEEESEAKIIGE
jgi:translation initiation factor 5